jgi:serine/threonine-protein kinase
MAITDPFVLADGVVLTPVRELPDTIRRGLSGDDDDFAIIRPNSRITSKVIDSDAAGLIRQFSKPSTIGQAVARYSRGRPGEDAERLLEDALPLLHSLISAGLLVPPDSKGTRPIRASLNPGDNFEGWRVVRSVQTLEDTELYQVRSPDGALAALKIGPAPLAHEADILEAIGGTVAPKLLRNSDAQSPPWLLMEWRTGVDAQTACEDLGPAFGADRVDLAAAVIACYARLHELGIIHGDVHPRNILVDRGQSVQLIDFGFAVCSAGGVRAAPVDRAGVGFFFEPELAGAFLRGLPPPPASQTGEQYSIAALVYLLLTGSHYLDFSLERDRMMRQIAEDPMVPFAARSEAGAAAGLEAVLIRALSKDPDDRFPSMRAFADAWNLATPASQREERASLSAADPSVDRVHAELRAQLLATLGFAGPLLSNGPLPPPAASLNYGSGGIAYGLYRLACNSGDGELLALADAWSERAVREISHDQAFYNAELDVTPETVGRRALFHSAVGIHAVQALIAQARGDSFSHAMAVNAFLDAASEPCEDPGFGLDVTLGRAGILLASESLLGVLPPQAGVTGEIRDRLQGLARDILAHIWETIDRFAPISESPELSNLGIAHGWAGLLYATLRWCAFSHDPVPADLAERLHQLAACAEASGRGLQWKWDLALSSHEPGGLSVPGWCNGSAGYVFLWTQAHQAFGEGRYLELAEGAAWNAWERRHGIGSLCCGTGGQAYALLNLYRHTGDIAWLRRARQLSGLAAASSCDRPESLYKGALGVVVLGSDLLQPEFARMPIFESEV